MKYRGSGSEVGLKAKLKVKVQVNVKDVVR